jgi:hypothetical protein
MKGEKDEGVKLKKKKKIKNYLKEKKLKAWGPNLIDKKKSKKGAIENNTKFKKCIKIKQREITKSGIIWKYGGPVMNI